MINAGSGRIRVRDRLLETVAHVLPPQAIAQGQPQVARHHLETGLPIARQNHKQRRIAFYNYALARWKKAFGKPTAAVAFATESIAAFERLGMTREVQEVTALLQSP